MKPLTLSTIQEVFPNLIVDRIGSDVTVSGFASMEDYRAGDIIFFNSDDTRKLLDDPPSAMVTTAKIVDQLSVAVSGILVCEDVQLAHALIRQRFDDHDLHNHEWPRIHPAAVVHDSVTIPPSVTIAPGVVVGRDAQLGDNVVIQCNSVIEHDAQIGAGSVIQSGVLVGFGCRIGERVRVKSGCVIGGEGFGFARDRKKQFHRVPHKGIVVIEDDVVIGANCNIDRGTYGETRICRRTKIDALCHIAHNVFIDEDCAITAQTAIAGSSRLGKRVLASGQTGILDHRRVADDVVLVHRAGVTQDITEPGMHAATPTQPFREYTRNIAAFKNLSDLRQRVKSLEQKIKKYFGQD